MKKFKDSVMRKSRRVSALQRLEAQLRRGTKPDKNNVHGKVQMLIPLSEKDVTRINNEIETLKARV